MDKKTLNPKNNYPFTKYVMLNLPSTLEYVADNYEWTYNPEDYKGDKKRALQLFLAEADSDNVNETSLSTFNETYFGLYKSSGAFARDYMKAWCELAEVPDMVMRNIDWDKAAADLTDKGQFFYINDIEGGCYVFRVKPIGESK